MAPLLGHVDAVHVLTSLTRFEALLRGRDLTCHGVPLFAGWELTRDPARDLASVPARRTRHASLDELVATTLIRYPRYLDPSPGSGAPPKYWWRASRTTRRDRRAVLCGCVICRVGCSGSTADGCWGDGRLYKGSAHRIGQVADGRVGENC